MTQPNITIIATSKNGAYLITDGVHQAWTRPASRRSDGTWTAGAYKALEKSTEAYDPMYNQKKEEEWNQRKAEFAAARAKEREEQQELVTVSINKSKFDFNSSGKAIKIKTGRKIRLYGRLCNQYEYLPASLVKFEYQVDTVNLIMPRWLYQQKAHCLN